MIAQIDTRAEYQDLFGIYWPIGLGVIVAVWLLTAFALWRYRAGREGRPSAKHESNSEKLYAVLLAGVVAALVYFTFSTMSESDADTEPDALGGVGIPAGAERLEVRTTAARWNWRFEYPQHGIVEEGAPGDPATLVVPAGIPVEFEQTSLDVVHSFYIPELRFKRDVFPGRTHRFALRFPDAGEYGTGECAEFCGLRHSYMTFEVRALPAEEFRRWAAGEGGGS